MTVRSKFKTSQYDLKSPNKVGSVASNITVVVLYSTKKSSLREFRTNSLESSQPHLLKRSL